MTGLAGLTLTSATGAKFQLMPIAASSSPLMAAAVCASRLLRPAPSAMLPGSWVAGGPIRATMPPSWSMPTSDGTAMRWLERGVLDAVGETRDLVGVLHAVGPGEVDDAAGLVAVDQLLGVVDAVQLLVRRDVGRVLGVGGACRRRGS